ncbi:hypothetical protein V6N11_014060 [Hibiscus sabdariffa]|uniref:Uncharacterized protein n=1 Tax=Hibiscus sabdariffa TaxID=183260 RepID=A0ABR2AG46_9ROSI
MNLFVARGRTPRESPSDPGFEEPGHSYILPSRRFLNLFIFLSSYAYSESDVTSGDHAPLLYSSFSEESFRPLRPQARNIVHRTTTLPNVTCAEGAMESGSMGSRSFAPVRVMEVEDRTCSVPRPCLLRRRLKMMGILSIKKRHRHRLSIQSVFPGLPNTLLIRNKPPAIEKRSKVPYSGCKAEEEGEWAQPHQQPAFSTRKELKMKQESVFTIYEAAMVRAGKHGNCIGGRGRRSAFYLGLAAKFSELLKLSREYQMLTVTKVTDFRWTRSQRVQSNSVTSLRLQKRSPTLIVGPKGRTLLLTCYIPAFLHGSARSSSPASPFPLSPFLPSKTGRMEYSQVVRHRFLVPACKGSNPFTPDYEDPIGSVKNDYRGSG